ncbi:MAG: hypothetical protein M5R40_07445 [Anaerolineae bacterium]|nr:hypothetical protein [Anaerolineae bacterium]
MSSGFDIIYANPPYDNLVEVGLTLVAAGHVSPGGLLVTVLPEPATIRVLDALTGTEKGFTLLFAAFAPDPEWKQVLTVLRRERHSYYAKAWQPAPFGAWAPPAAPLEPDISLAIRRGDPAVAHFAMRRVANLLDAAHDVAEAARPGGRVDVTAALVQARAADSGGALRPLAALRPGHLAALLAAGVLNQVEVELDLDGQPRRLALKGTTEHVVTHSVETEGDHVYNVTRRTPEASLKVLDLDTGKIETVTPANPRFAEIVQEALPRSWNGSRRTWNPSSRNSQTPTGRCSRRCAARIRRCRAACCPRRCAPPLRSWPACARTRPPCSSARWAPARRSSAWARGICCVTARAQHAWS